MLPRKKKWAELPELILAASAIRLERWRYNYGRKITPQRLANVKLSHSTELLRYTDHLYRKFRGVISASLAPYETEDEFDVRIAQERIAELEASPDATVRGDVLKARLLHLEEQ